MRCMIFIKADDDSEAGVMPGEEVIAAMGRYNEELADAGVLLAGEGLHPSSKGARVRFAKGTSSVIDGPFAETKELIAGFWIVQVKDLDEAIEWAKRCPHAPEAEFELEVRRIFDLDEFDESVLSPEQREAEQRLRDRLAGS